MSIIFKEDTHQYFNTDNGREYLSGTKFLHLFEPEFDKYSISKRVAEKEGRSQQSVLDEWAATSKLACETGTKIHTIMENYIKFSDYKDESFSLIILLQRNRKWSGIATGLNVNIS